MKRYLPFIFPSIAVLIIIFLAIRWYNLSTSNPGQINEFAKGIDVESIAVDDVMFSAGVADMSRAELINPEGKSQGAIRYQIEDDKVKLSVLSSLPELDEGFYQVWFKEVGSDAVKKAFVLNYQKGGFIGTAAISKEVLPFEVLVTKEMDDDQSPEEKVLEAIIDEVEESEK